MYLLVSVIIMNQYDRQAICVAKGTRLFSQYFLEIKSYAYNTQHFDA